MSLTINRSPDGTPIFKGGESKQLSAQFGLANTSLPSWLTLAPDTSGTSTVSGISAGGELTLTTAATINDGVSVNMPQIDLSKFSYVEIRANGVRCGSTPPARMHMAIASRSDVVNNTNNGVLLQKVPSEPEIYLRRPSNGASQGANSGNPQAVAFAPFFPNKRWDMGIILLPQQGAAYAMLGDQVMHARDISSGLVLGVATPHIRIETNSTTAHSLSFSSISLTLKLI